MKKLIRGIVEFRRSKRATYKDTFAKLALGQSPDALFISCSDSRVAVNVFASTDPGDVFVIRNVGNLVPQHSPSDNKGAQTTDTSVVAALEFSLGVLNVSDIIVCGHSECAAMKALVNGQRNQANPGLWKWLKNGDPSTRRFEKNKNFAPKLAAHNKLSQLSVIQQLENLRSYPIVQEKLQENSLRLHGWWFELTQADVYAYEEAANEFVVLDEKEAANILARLDTK